MTRRTDAQILADEIASLITSATRDSAVYDAACEVLDGMPTASADGAATSLRDALCDGEWLASVFGADVTEDEDAENQKAVDDLYRAVKIALGKIQRRRRWAREERALKRDLCRRLALCGFAAGLTADELLAGVDEQRHIAVYKKFAAIFAPPRHVRYPGKRWRRAR